MLIIKSYIKKTAALSVLALVTGSLAAQTDTTVTAKDSGIINVIVKKPEKKGVRVSGTIKDDVTKKD
jgi:hypothetical protein